MHRILIGFEPARTESPFVARLQLKLRGTRAVHRGSLEVWVVPGAGGACIVIPTETVTTGPPASARSIYTGCAVTRTMLHEGLVDVGSQPDGTELIFGLVPDGTTAVLRSPTGLDHNVPVVTNVLLAAVKPGSMTLTLHKSDGTSVSLPYDL